MGERRVVTKEYAVRYRKAGRKEKGRILGEFVESTGYHRVYAAGSGTSLDQGEYQQ